MDFETARALAWEQAEHRASLSERLLERLANGWTISREHYDSARLTARQARAQFAGLMGDFDLLITPAARGEAPLGHATTGDALFNRIWTLLGVPCITLPCGFGVQGLPLGMQLVASIDNDTALLARAHWAANALVRS